MTSRHLDALNAARRELAAAVGEEAAQGLTYMLIGAIAHKLDTKGRVTSRDWRETLAMLVRNDIEWRRSRAKAVRP